MPDGRDSLPEVRLLVVDDDAIVARDLEQTLGDLGYDVIGTAGSAAEAVEAARAEAPDLVLMDVRMPGEMDGIDGARAIEDELDVPVVYLTAYADRDTLRRATEVDPYGYVVKPFDARELEAAVELALQRKRRERVREQRERWFERIIERVQDIVVVVDGTGVVEYASPALEDVLGYNPESRVGRKAMELVHPVDREAFGDTIAAAFGAPGESVETDVRVRSSEGEWRLLHVVGRAYPPRSPERASRMVLNARDVTERRAEQEKLEASEQRYRLLFEEGIAGAFQASLDGEFLDANPALVELLDHRGADDLVGKAVDAVVREEDWSALVDRLEEDGTAVNREVRAARRDGGECWLLLSCGVSRVPDRDEPVIIGTVVDITERKRLEADLQWMAYHDPLTGLVNRRSLSEHASRYLSLAERRGDRLAVVYLDLAGFKAINDELGHEAGDAVLSAVAERLQDEGRESDIVARVGGDEFVVLLPEVESAEAAVGVAERLARTLEAPVAFEDDDVPVDGQFGVAVFPDHGTTFDDLVAAADTAMYQLKKGGGADVALYDEDATARGGGPGDGAEELRRALDDGDLLVHYQPIVRAADEAVIAVEALLRWRRSYDRTSSAGRFLPLAERVGLMPSVDAHMLELVHDDLMDAVLPAGLEWISVNLAPASLVDTTVGDRVSTLASELGSRGLDLVVEIPETRDQRELRGARAALDGLRGENVAVALDDFGGGPSPLALLSSLPADIVKVSRGGLPAVRRAIDREKAMRGLIELLHGLGVRVVVEDVKRDEGGDRSGVDGADYLQGYAVGRPAMLSALSRAI